MALQGTLDTFSLPDVLRLLAGTGKTGRLRLDGDRGHGSVWMRDGAVVASRADRALDGAPNEEVVFELLRFESGAFAFDTDDETDDAGKPEEIDGLLRRASALLNEWNELEVVVPSLDHRVRLCDDLPSDEVTIDADRWRSVVAVASGRSVSELAGQLGLSELGVSRVVRDLVDLGVAEVSEPETRRRDAAAPPRTLRRSEGSGLLGRRAARTRLDDTPPPAVPTDATPATGTQRAGWLQGDSGSQPVIPAEPATGAAANGPAPLGGGPDRPRDREQSGANGARGSRRGRAAPADGDRASHPSPADGQPPPAPDRPGRTLASRRARDRSSQGPPTPPPVAEASAGRPPTGPVTPAPRHPPVGPPAAPAGPPPPAGSPRAPAGPPAAPAGPPAAPAGPPSMPAGPPVPAGPPATGGQARGRGTGRTPSRRGPGRAAPGEAGQGQALPPYDTGRTQRPRLSDTGRIRALSSSAMPADLRWAADEGPAGAPRESHPFSGVHSLGAPRIGGGGSPFGGGPRLGEGEVASHVAAMSPEARAAVEATIGPAGGAQGGRGPAPGDDVAQRGRLVHFLSSIRS
ncbi:MAG: DUF4388 domain-containing protein [Acidimicrobiia bacterium]